MYNCTVHSESHSWRVSSIPVDQVRVISRGTPKYLEDNHEIRLTEDKGDAIVSSLTILMVHAMYDGSTVSCDDALKPNRGVEEETTVNVLGIRKYTVCQIHE